MHDGQGGAALSIRVTPRARKTEIGELMADGTLRIRIQEPPVEGKANKALIGFLAKLFDVSKSRVQIVAGHRGLDKIVSILDLPAKEVQAKIEQALDQEEAS
ncbi:MAG: DUF167 domain-containing protein [Anaerolineales bacterium]